MVEPVFRQQLDEASLADRAGADLGLHVVLDDVEADVGEDQLPDVLAQLALLDHLDRRNPQRLLPHLGGVRVVAAGDGAADVGLVSLDGGPRDEPALEEHRLEHRDVVVLVAEAEHVVVEDHVARVDLVAVVRLDVLAHRGEREGEDRQVLGLLQHPAVGVVEPGDEILRLAQNRRARRLLHRDAHLVGDRLEGPGVDGQQNRVDLHVVTSCERAARTAAVRSSRPFRKSTNEPNVSTIASHDPVRTIAVVTSSTIAGPAMRWPKRSR